MQKYLERRAYSRLKTWKENSQHSTMEIFGARQVGKTYLVNKFADEQYQQKIYINLLELSGELFMGKYHELIQQMRDGLAYENPVHELIKRFRPDFNDSRETIDEIQESAEIYNRVREFTRELKSDFIIIESYPGRILNKEFKYSSGDLDYLEVQTLDFLEFLTALGKTDLYGRLDLYGESEPNVYHELQKYYDDYCKIGGYPSVILKYLENASIAECQTELIKIIRLFTNEQQECFQKKRKALRRIVSARNCKVLL